MSCSNSTVVDIGEGSRTAGCAILSATTRAQRQPRSNLNTATLARKFGQRRTAAPA